MNSKTQTKETQDDFKFHLYEGMMLPVIKKDRIIEEPFSIIVTRTENTVGATLANCPSLKPTKAEDKNAKASVYEAKILGDNRSSLFQIIHIEGSFKITILPIYKLPKNVHSLGLIEKHNSIVYKILTDAISTISRNSLPLHYRAIANMLLSPEFQANLQANSLEYDSVRLNEPLRAVDYWKYTVFAFLDTAYLYRIERNFAKQKRMINFLRRFLTKYSSKVLDTLRHEGIHHLESVSDLIGYFQNFYNRYELPKGFPQEGKNAIFLEQNQMLDELQKLSEPAKDIDENIQVEMLDETTQDPENTYTEVPPAQMKDLSTAKRSSFPHIDEEQEYPEGNVIPGRYHRKQRNKDLVEKAKQKRLEEVGEFKCDVCDFKFSDTYGKLGQDYIECHHLKPVSKLNVEDKTRIKDLALVCSNCHRMLHRKSHCLSVEKLKEIVKTQQNKNNK